MSKRIEKIVLGEQFRYLDESNLWHTFQIAYRSQNSTDTGLLRVFNDLLAASDFGFISILALLDLRAAFGTIDHSIILTRLGKYFWCL